MSEYKQGWRAAMEYQRDMSDPAPGDGFRAVAVFAMGLGASVAACSALAIYYGGPFDLIRAIGGVIGGLAMFVIGVGCWRKADRLTAEHTERLRDKWKDHK